MCEIRLHFRGSGLCSRPALARWILPCPSLLFWDSIESSRLREMHESAQTSLMLLSHVGGHLLEETVFDRALIVAPPDIILGRMIAFSGCAS